MRHLDISRATPVPERKFVQVVQTQHVEKIGRDRQTDDLVIQVADQGSAQNDARNSTNNAQTAGLKSRRPVFTEFAVVALLTTELMGTNAIFRHLSNLDKPTANPLLSTSQLLIAHT
jgi:hypothetical protein